MPLRSLAADDIFISYTRRDASTYAAGLADELTKRGFSCFIDKLGTDPNADLPDMLKRKIRSCAMLVVICTEWAGTRQTIEEEIGEFLHTGRRTSIVPVDFGDAVYKARWYKLIEGIAPEPEKNELALDDGNPSPSVISRIEKQFNYARRNQRLRRVTYATAAVLAVLILASVVAAVYAGQQIKKADAAGAEAANARRDAGAAKAQAKEEQLKAEAAGREARDAQTRADEARLVADKAEAKAAEQTRLADKAAAEAREQTRLAEVAARRARDAQAEAARQQLIGESRSIASRSQTLLSRNPDELPRSVSLAIGALRKSRTVEADSALRESVALLPHLRRRVVYTGDNFQNQIALSPNGRHYATVSDGKLRVYESGGTAQLKEIPCECWDVALSNGLAFAAARTKEELKILDLGSGAAQVFKLEEGVTYSNFALSPGGRYLARSARSPDTYGCVDRVELFDTRSGKVIKTLNEEFGMSINDVTFGPSGILAVGGGGCVEQQVSFGRVIIWPLKYESQDGAVESLNEDGFASRISERHDMEVLAVAPGPSESSYATDRGVWKMVQQNLYEPVAHIPGIGSKPIAEATHDVRRSTYDVAALAFSPGGERLTLIRNLLEGTGGGTGHSKQLEVWDSAGHQESARAYEKDVRGLAFRPGGRFVAAYVQGAEPGPFQLFNADDGAKVKEAGVAPAGDETASTVGTLVSPDLRFTLTAGDSEARVRDAWESKTASIPFAAVLSRLNAAALAPGGAFVALAGKSKEDGGGELVIVYRRAADNTYAEWNRLRLDEQTSAIELSADGQHLAVVNTNARVWDVPRKRDVTPEGLRKREQVRDIKFSPEGRFVAALDFSADVLLPHSVRVWRLADGREFEQLTHTNGDPLYLFSPGDRFLLTAGGDRLTRLVDLSTGRVQTLNDDARNLTAAFSPDGSLLGVGSDEGIVEVYLTNAAETPITRLRHAGAINALAFSEDNRRVATASGVQGDEEDFAYYGNEENFPVRIWLLRPEDLIAEAQARLDALPKVNR